MDKVFIIFIHIFLCLGLPLAESRTEKNAADKDIRELYSSVKIVDFTNQTLQQQMSSPQETGCIEVARNNNVCSSDIDPLLNGQATKTILEGLDFKKPKTYQLKEKLKDIHRQATELLKTQPRSVVSGFYKKAVVSAMRDVFVGNQLNFADFVGPEALLDYAENKTISSIQSSVQQKLIDKFFKDNPDELDPKKIKTQISNLRKPKWILKHGLSMIVLKKVVELSQQLVERPEDAEEILSQLLDEEYYAKLGVKVGSVYLTKQFSNASIKEIAKFLKNIERLRRMTQACKISGGPLLWLEAVIEETAVMIGSSVLESLVMPIIDKRLVRQEMAKQLNDLSYDLFDMRGDRPNDPGKIEYGVTEIHAAFVQSRELLNRSSIDDLQEFIKKRDTKVKEWEELVPVYKIGLPIEKNPDVTQNNKINDLFQKFNLPFEERRPLKLEGELRQKISTIETLLNQMTTDEWSILENSSFSGSSPNEVEEGVNVLRSRFNINSYQAIFILKNCRDLGKAEMLKKALVWLEFEGINFFKNYPAPPPAKNTFRRDSGAFPNDAPDIESFDYQHYLFISMIRDLAENDLAVMDQKYQEDAKKRFQSDVVVKNYEQLLTDEKTIKTPEKIMEMLIQPAANLHDSFAREKTLMSLLANIGKLNGREASEEYQALTKAALKIRDENIPLELEVIKSRFE
jgi:hypothetical protein